MPPGNHRLFQDGRGWQPPCSELSRARSTSFWKSSLQERSTAMSEHHEDKDDRAKIGRGKRGRDRNEGEGNRTADRKYREGVRRHVESGASEPAADEAQRALESDELRGAEDEAKSGRKR